jgi:hypothetical protein
MKCPACGLEQPKSDECQKCGTVFEKFFKLQDERRRKRAEEENSIKEEKDKDLEVDPTESELKEKREIFRSVSKKKIPVAILTLRNRVEGNIYVTQNFRMTDLLNSPEVTFIAVTEAKVYSLETGELMEEPDFISINKNHVTLITEEIF